MLRHKFHNLHKLSVNEIAVARHNFKSTLNSSVLSGLNHFMMYLTIGETGLLQI